VGVGGVVEAGEGVGVVSGVGAGVRDGIGGRTGVGDVGTAAHAASSATPTVMLYRLSVRRKGLNWTITTRIGQPRAAQRPRAKLPGGSWQRTRILAHAGGPGALPYRPARRVSFSELLGVPVPTWQMPFLQASRAADYGIVKKLKPFGGGRYAMVCPEPYPDWPGLRPRKEYGPREEVVQQVDRCEFPLEKQAHPFEEDGHDGKRYVVFLRPLLKVGLVGLEFQLVTRWKWRTKGSCPKDE